MYRCPNCQKMTISGMTQFSPPFNGMVECPNCHAELRVKRKFSNYLVAIYLIARAMLYFVFGLHIDYNFAIEFPILLILFFFQVRLSTYELIKRPA